MTQISVSSVSIACEPVQWSCWLPQFFSWLNYFNIPQLEKMWLSCLALNSSRCNYLRAGILQVASPGNFGCFQSEKDGFILVTTRIDKSQLPDQAVYYLKFDYFLIDPETSVLIAFTFISYNLIAWLTSILARMPFILS